MGSPCSVAVQPTCDTGAGALGSPCGVEVQPTCEHTRGLGLWAPLKSIHQL